MLSLTTAIAFGFMFQNIATQHPQFPFRNYEVEATVVVTLLVVSILLFCTYVFHKRLYEILLEHEERAKAWEERKRKIDEQLNSSFFISDSVKEKID